MTVLARRWPGAHPREFLVLAALSWLVVYLALIPASEALVAALPVDRDSHLGGALQFFLYDTPNRLLKNPAIRMIWSGSCGCVMCNIG